MSQRTFEAIFEDYWFRSDYGTGQHPSWGWLIDDNGTDAETLGAGEGIKVVVIDQGGMDYHEDLIGQYDVALSYDFTGSGTINYVPSGGVYNHGPAVSGIIACLDNGIDGKGIASKAKLVMLKTKYWSEHKSALAYCVAHASEIHVVCVALQFWELAGIDQDAIDNITALVAAGVIVVAGVGNSNKTYPPGGGSLPSYLDLSQNWWPSTQAGVVGIGASGQRFVKDGRCDERTYSSVVGDQVDFVAPGCGIGAPHIESSSMLYAFGETSAATAFAAGIFAILKSRYGAFYTGQEIVQIAKATAINNASYYLEKIPDSGYTYWDPWHGYGFLTVGGPVEWDQQEFNFDVTMTMETSMGLEHTFRQLPAWEMTLSITGMTPYQVVLNLLFSMTVSASMSKAVLIKKLLALVTTIKTGVNFSLLNSMNLDFAMSFALVNDLLEKLHTSVDFVLDLDGLARVEAAIQLLNRLTEAGVSYGDYYFDKEHNG